MNTECVAGNIRIHFESRARRRWFVAFFYAVLAVFDFVGYSNSAKSTVSPWISIGCMILFAVLFIVFTGVGGDVRARGDERETHRREHAHFKAYYFPLYVLVGALLIGSFTTPNPITPVVPMALRGFFVKLPYFLSMTAFLLYITLPRAILLWTEPDIEIN
jgi:hypothetical protein